MRSVAAERMRSETSHRAHERTDVLRLRNAIAGHNKAPSREDLAYLCLAWLLPSSR